MMEVLKTLPRVIGNLTKLRILAIHDEDKSEIRLEVLPDFIGNLKNLRILDLSGNNLRTLPESIGNLKNLEELYISNNREFSKLPDSIGNLENLKALKLAGTSLVASLFPKSMANLTNLKDFSHPSDSYVWYYSVIKESLKQWSLPPLAENEWVRVSVLDWSNKNLTRLPFCTYMLTNLKELDVSNNQLTKIPYLLIRLTLLKKLYLYNNPNLNHLPDFLWDMRNLKELKIDGKLTSDLPRNARVSLDAKTLENGVLDLTLAGKNKTGMSNQDLANKTGPYIVYLE